MAQGFRVVKGPLTRNHPAPQLTHLVLCFLWHGVLVCRCCSENSTHTIPRYEGNSTFTLAPGGKRKYTLELLIRLWCEEVKAVCVPRDFELQILSCFEGTKEYLCQGKDTQKKRKGGFVSKHGFAADCERYLDSFQDIVPMVFDLGAFVTRCVGGNIDDAWHPQLVGSRSPFHKFVLEHTGTLSHAGGGGGA